MKRPRKDKYLSRLILLPNHDDLDDDEVPEAFEGRKVKRCKRRGGELIDVWEKASIIVGAAADLKGSELPPNMFCAATSGHSTRRGHLSVFTQRPSITVCVS